jgi:glycosyltransferase involved in cell wall biosynthesis
MSVIALHNGRSMTMSAAMKLGIVIPCYNEEEVLPETIRQMTGLIGRLVSLGKISADSKIFFVDDGSKDHTWALIKHHAAQNDHVAGIKLSRNRGHQIALIAGLFTAEGDALVSIDADLQDDIDAIEEMVDRFLAGAEIVYGVRKQRETDTAFKRLTAQGFYRLISTLGAESIYNHADYRLMSRRAVECLKQFAEVNLYLRGIVPLIGFKSEIVYYNRTDRLAGESKYPLKQMIALALDAITSFSVVPLRVITFTGFGIFLGSMLVTLWALWVRFFTDAAVPGWTSIVLPMYFLGGIQLFCIGMLGEYLGKTYAEAKSRPRFFIEQTVSGKVIERDASDRARARATSSI